MFLKMVMILRRLLAKVFMENHLDKSKKESLVHGENFQLKVEEVGDGLMKRVQKG